jgi:hypothetical protein
LITPANFGSGAGSCLPLIVVVALGEPGSPLTSGAADADAGAGLLVAGPRRGRRSNWAELLDPRDKRTTAARTAKSGLRWHRLEQTLFQAFIAMVLSEEGASIEYR